MKRNNNILCFKPSTQVNVINEPFTDQTYCPAGKILYFIGYFRLGQLETNKGNEVLALKFLEDSLDILLLEPIPGTEEARRIIDRHPPTIVLDHIHMPYSEIAPEYNCHGLCFGDSLYRIPDATIILQDEYEECKKEEATCVVYYENNTTVHSALLKEKTLKVKFGYRGEHCFTDIEKAAGDINFTDIKFFKPK